MGGKQVDPRVADPGRLDSLCFHSKGAAGGRAVRRSADWEGACG